jgi:hypothetical protein
MKKFKLFITIVSLTAFIVSGFLVIHGKAQALELKFGHVGAPGAFEKTETRYG